MNVIGILWELNSVEKVGLYIKYIYDKFLDGLSNSIKNRARDKMVFYLCNSGDFFCMRQ